MSTNLDENTISNNDLQENVVADDELTRHYLNAMNHCKNESPMTTQQWIKAMTLSIITGGIINLFWAASKTVPAEKRNWSQALLVVLSVVLVIYMVGMIIVTVVALALLESYNGSLW